MRVFIVSLVVLVVSSVVLSAPSRPRLPRDLHPIQMKLLALMQPKPVVDTIKPGTDLKNTNNHPIGRKFVSGFEGLSRLATSALDYPKQQAATIGSAITDKLNMIGAKLVGLQ